MRYFLSFLFLIGSSCISTDQTDDVVEKPISAGTVRVQEVTKQPTKKGNALSRVDSLERDAKIAEHRRMVEAQMSRFPYRMVYRSDIIKNAVQPCIELAFDEGLIPLPNTIEGRITFMHNLNKQPGWEESIEDAITVVAQLETDEERALAYLVLVQSCIEVFRANQN